MPRRRIAVLAAVWLAGALWGWTWLDRGWVPHDEGALAQSAERVLAGELPHADFDEIYTGGLSFANALAFRVFGVRLTSLRYPLYALFLAWIPAVFWIATRFVPPGPGGLATALAVALGPPNYSAAVPSWYVMFLATFALAAALRFRETRRPGWLAVAGACAGLAVLVKVVGLYLLAALVAWIVFVEQEEDPAGPGTDTGRGGSFAVTALAIAMVGAAAAVLSGHPGPSQAAQFGVPIVALAAFLVHEEWRTERSPLGRRSRGWAALGGPLVAGALLPVAAFVVPYVAGDAVGALVEGVFVAPRTRFRFATFPAPRLETAAWVLAPGLLLAWTARWPRGRRPAVITGALLAVVLLAAGEGPVYRAVWSSMRWAIPAVVAAGLWVLARRPERPGRSAALAPLAVAALLGLVQFPFSAPVYFLYVAPLAVLAAVALAGRTGVPAPAFVLVTAFYLAFAVTRVTPGFIYAMGHAWSPDRQTERLALPRGGLRVSERDAEVYARLVDLLREEGAVWAGPDCPEVYFLAGRPNPSRALFDFTGGPAPGEAEVLAALERAGVRAVVLNTEPGFSEPVAPDVARAIARRYPHMERVGPFEVRWRS